jgi:sugar lactone lactonase YvrE
VTKYTVAADGGLTSAGALISGLDSPDSMCLDAAGNLYIGVSAGLQVVRRDGRAPDADPHPIEQRHDQLRLRRS